jgi:uncharacterized membrane protein
MTYLNRDADFWRAVAGGAFGLTLALVWLRFGFGGFVLALAFAVAGALAARFSAGE